jgi:hypothetical protein
MSDLRQQADVAAQAALRASVDYQAKHGKRSPLLDACYESAERIIDAIDDHLGLVALASGVEYVDEWRLVAASGDYTAGVGLPDIALADGDHFAGMPS